ncbi:RNase H family protein [Trifolium repens]|nr:RNase H family protein [Trifolium repens]
MFLNLLHAKRRLHGQSSLLFTQANAFLESDSIVIYGPPDNHPLSKDCSKAKTIAKNSASFKSFIPTDAANSANISPQSFLKTPPIPAAPGLPFEEPSTFHFHSFCAGLCHSKLLLHLCLLPHLHTACKSLST